MTRLARHQRDWQELATLDPLWAIASTPVHRYGGWDEEEFMASGRRKAAKLLGRLETLGVPAERGRALDFGCGVGRLTLPLAEAFEQATGVDIAPAMIERARRLAGNRTDVRYVLNERDDLQVLAGERFDLVYTGIVLQHLPSRELALGYLRALADLVAPGGVLVAQIPVAMRWDARIQLGRRAYEALRALRVPPGFVYRRLRLQPMRMTWVPRHAVEQCVEAAGLEIVAGDQRMRGTVASLTLYAVRR